VPGVNAAKTARWRRLRLLVAGAVSMAAVGTAGCGEKSEPAVHPPTTAPTTTAAPTTTTPAPTQTKPAPAPTAPVPKQTP
jgi:hypothetical protein